MERVLEIDERIRRAEEIYARRNARNVNIRKMNTNTSKTMHFSSLKKILIQLTICILIYSIFYLINTTNYSFSEETLKKTKEIISKDYDFVRIIQ